MQISPDISSISLFFFYHSLRFTIINTLIFLLARTEGWQCSPLRRLDWWYPWEPRDAAVAAHNICLVTSQAKSSEEMGHWLGLLLSESGSKTDPEEFTYDYVDADRVSCIVSAAKNSFLYVWGTTGLLAAGGVGTKLDRGPSMLQLWVQLDCSL